MKTVEDLSEAKVVVNLRSEYPLAFRVIFARSLHWLLAFLLLVVTITLFDSVIRGSVPAESVSLRFFDMICFTLIIIGTVLIVGKLAYEILYFMLYHYRVEEEHLVITKGLIYRARASVALAKVNDVNLYRGPIDFIFGLYDIRIMTPSPLADSTGIEGLTPKNAVALQNRLLAMVETTLPGVDQVAADAISPPPEPQPDDAKMEAMDDGLLEEELEGSDLTYDSDDNSPESVFKRRAGAE